MARQRRGGFRPPELRGTLGTLLRTTLAQAGGLRDAIERGARDALSNRRRSEVVADLGEVVLDLIRRGEIELEQLPEARDLVAKLDELDAHDGGDEDDRDIAPPATRSRFDDRGRDDGTVSSASRWAAPIKKAAARVWRPTPAPIEESERPTDEITARDRPAVKKLGGISFGNDGDDDDLAEYMHPDDVPPKAK